MRNAPAGKMLEKTGVILLWRPSELVMLDMSYAIQNRVIEVRVLPLAMRRGSPKTEDLFEIGKVARSMYYNSNYSQFRMLPYLTVSLYSHFRMLPYLTVSLYSHFRMLPYLTVSLYSSFYDFNRSICVHPFSDPVGQTESIHTLHMWFSTNLIRHEPNQFRMRFNCVGFLLDKYHPKPAHP